MASRSKVDITGRRESDGTHIDLSFEDGTKRSFHLPPTHPLYDDLAAHGFSKKVRDQLSSCATTAASVEAFDALANSFNKGKWNVLRNSEGKAAVGVLAKALSRLYGRSVEDAQAFVATLSKKQQADARKEERVAVMIAQINAEEEKTDTATSTLLDSFGDQSQIVENNQQGAELSAE